MFRRVLDVATEELLYGVRCVPYAARPAWRAARVPVLVNGSPKTGTTWVARLLESIPAFRAVGHIGRGTDRHGGILPGEVAHGHHAYSERLWEWLNGSGARIVLTIRDPRDQVVSRIHHIRRDPTHAWHRRMQELPDDEALSACIEGGPRMASLASHLALTESWLRVRRVIPLRNEDLLANPSVELRRVLEFLGVAIDDDLLHAIVMRNRFERLAMGRRIWRRPRRQGEDDARSHFRKGLAGDWRQHLTDAHLHRINEVAGTFLSDHGYDAGYD